MVVVVTTYYHFSDVLFFVFFFFSSRRRHTRCLSDWSSDVCSSDLPLGGRASRAAPLDRPRPAARHRAHGFRPEIGRASCRDRVYISEVAGSLKKKEENNEKPKAHERNAAQARNRQDNADTVTRRQH